MSASYTCDGCGAAVIAPKQVGRILRRDYCESCAQRVEAFLDAEDALRSRLHDQFVIDRAALIAEAGAFKLPDVPDA